MKLSDVFEAIAHKRLSSVDIPGKGSNQHEANGSSSLKDFFGIQSAKKGRINWRYFADDVEPAFEENNFTFYDARAKSSARTGRTEWRLYYSGDFLFRANVDDLLVLARTRSKDYFGLVFQHGSAWWRAAQELFQIHSSQGEFDEISTNDLDKTQLEFLGRQILSELGFDDLLPVTKSDEDIVIEKFGDKFPTTLEMSNFARTMTECDLNHVDETLTRWLEREEQLFRALESTIIGKRISLGFDSVDEFIAFSLSVQNRRKSRMGHAFQNHLAAIFEKKKLRFTAQARTEASNRPDFIFPGEVEYSDPKFDAALLTMLGVKSTSKDRWRQILAEADRIPNKHLCTLEAGISTKQTDEMSRQKLTLVVPLGLHATYTAKQQGDLLSLDAFIKLLRQKEGA